MLKRLLAAAALCLLTAAPVWAAEAKPLQIGVILPITGPAAAYGDMAWKGMQLAQKHRPTVLGRPVKLLLVDNKSDKVESSNAANRLIQRDEVPVIIGALSSGPTLAAAPVAEAAGVPLVSGWATNPVVTMGKRYVFRTCFIDPFQGGVAARFAYNELGARTAAMLVDISRDYSVGLAAFFSRTFGELGGKVVEKALYSNGDQEFSAQLGAIAAKNPDLIYLPGYLPEEPLIIRQAREMGLKQPFLSGDAAQADETIAIGGKAVEGLMLTTHFDEQGATTEAGHRYSKEYHAAYGKSPDPLGALGYDTYNVVLDAIEKAGGPDREGITQALDQLRGFTGVCGVMSLVDHDAVKPAVILKVKDGKFTYLATVPPDLPEAKK